MCVCLSVCGAKGQESYLQDLISTKLWILLFPFVFTHVFKSNICPTVSNTFTFAQICFFLCCERSVLCVRVSHFSLLRPALTGWQRTCSRHVADESQTGLVAPRLWKGVCIPPPYQTCLILSSAAVKCLTQFCWLPFKCADNFGIMEEVSVWQNPRRRLFCLLRRLWKKKCNSYKCCCWLFTLSWVIYTTGNCYRVYCQHFQYLEPGKNTIAEWVLGWKS